MPSITYRRRFRQAVVIDETFLERLYECARQFLPDKDCEVAVETDSHLAIKANNLADVLSSEILQTESIKKISLSAASYASLATKRFSFEVEKMEEFRTCELTLESTEANEIMAIRTRLENLIRSASQWYSFLRPQSYVASMFFSGFLCSIVLGIVLLTLKYLQILDGWPSVLFIFSLNVFIATSLINAVARRLFPAVEFDIGYSKRSANRLARFRNLLFVIIGLGVIVSLAASYIFKIISEH